MCVHVCVCVCVCVCMLEKHKTRKGVLGRREAGDASLQCDVVARGVSARHWAGCGETFSHVADTHTPPHNTHARTQELTRVGKEDKLKGYEIVKAVALEPVQFSVEDDLMTPSFKLRRPQLQVRVWVGGWAVGVAKMVGFGGGILGGRIGFICPSPTNWGRGESAEEEAGVGWGRLGWRRGEGGLPDHLYLPLPPCLPAYLSVGMDGGALVASPVLPHAHNKRASPLNPLKPPLPPLAPLPSPRTHRPSTRPSWTPCTPPSRRPRR